MTDDPYNLQRFLTAQEPIYAMVRGELSRCRKTSHWMWFIFPQIIGLGSSPRSLKFAIRSKGEAGAYLAHPVLGARLLECTNLVCRCEGSSVGDIFPYPDDLKFHACVTLFHDVSGEAAFSCALERFFSGEPDRTTLDILAQI